MLLLHQVFDEDPAAVTLWSGAALYIYLQSGVPSSSCGPGLNERRHAVETGGLVLEEVQRDERAVLRLAACVDKRSSRA